MFSGEILLSQHLPSCTKNAFLEHRPGHLPLNQHSSSPVASSNEQKPPELLLRPRPVPDPGQGAPSQLTPNNLIRSALLGPVHRWRHGPRGSGPRPAQR